MRDSISDMKALVALAPVVVADNTIQNGNIIDRQGYESLAFIVTTGVLADTDATFSVMLTDGNDPALADGVLVAGFDMIQSPSVPVSFDFNADNMTRKIGYIGGKRYVRLTITPANNTGNAPLAAIAILEDGYYQPNA